MPSFPPTQINPSRRPRDLEPPITPERPRIPARVHLHQIAARRERHNQYRRGQNQQPPRNPHSLGRLVVNFVPSGEDTERQEVDMKGTESGLSMQIRAWKLLKGFLGRVGTGSVGWFVRLCASLRAVRRRRGNDDF